MTETPEVTLPEEEPALPKAEVEALLSTMAKALRAFNMYEPNNPVFQRFRSSLREAFEEVWAQTDELALGVTEKGFRYAGTVHSIGEGRDNMAFAFYKDGIRSLTFSRGFEDEVGRFMDAVNRALRREVDADDLITVLWEEDFASLQYGYVDLLSEGMAIPDEPLEDPGPLEGDFAIDGEEEGAEEAAATAGGEAAPPATLTRDDFDETLYFLDQNEIAKLQEEVEIEMERDLRRDVLHALFDRLEEPIEERQSTILDIMDQLLPLFLSRGDMAHSAMILEELDRLQADRRLIEPELRERIQALFDRLSEPDVLEQFVQAVEDGAVAPDSREVTLFFSQLHAQALPILIRFGETSESDAVRARLSSAIDGLAGRYPGEVDELLKSEEPTVVAGAARVAGRVGMAEAVEGLHAALEHPDPEVRMAIVEALTAIRLNPALQALTTALTDEDRDVRIAAAKALGAVRFASSRPALEDIIEGKRIRDADLTEKMAFFEAYGAVGGSTAVSRLDDVLNSKGLFGRRSPTELRACAALGLGKAGGAEARRALERARKDEDPIVRNAVVRALKGDLVRQ